MDVKTIPVLLFPCVFFPLFKVNHPLLSPRETGNQFLTVKKRKKKKPFIINLKSLFIPTVMAKAASAFPYRTLFSIS